MDIRNESHFFFEIGYVRRARHRNDILGGNGYEARVPAETIDGAFHARVA